MKQIFALFLLVLIELAVVAFTIWVCSLTMISSSGFSQDFRDNPVLFTSKRLLAGGVVTMIVSVVFIGVVRIFFRLVNVTPAYRTRQMFFVQWFFLLLIWVTCASIAIIASQMRMV